MNSLKKRCTGIAAAIVMVAATLTLAVGASPAQAGNHKSEGPFKTMSACKAAQGKYSTSWSHISWSCRYIAASGGFTAKGYWFWWRTNY